MRALVVYQTVLGHTGRLAAAIGEGLAGHLPVDVRPLEEQSTRIGGDVALLVIGGPRVAFGVHGQDELPVSVRDWALSVKAAGVMAALFDTDLEVDDERVTPDMLSAAERLLGRSGLLVEERATFWVEGGTAGELADGELDRTRQWGEFLGAKVVREAVG